MTAPHDGILRPSPDAVATELDGGAVVLNLRTKRYYSLNESGAVAWQAIERGASRAALVAALVGRFEVKDEQARAAVERIVGELAVEGLVREEP